MLCLTFFLNCNVVEKQDRIQLLEALIILFKSRQFGKNSEKSTQQTALFDEAENKPDLAAPETAEPVEVEAEAEHTPPKKATSGRKPLPKTLPRVSIEHDLPAHEKTCQCGCQKSCIGEESREQLDIIPAVIQPRKISCLRRIAQALGPAALPKNTRLTFG